MAGAIAHFAAKCKAAGPRLAGALVACALAAVTGPAIAASGLNAQAPIETVFANWLRDEIRPQAIAAGVSAAIFDKATAGLEPDWSLPEVTLPGQPIQQPDWQAEFRSPGAYFNEKTLASLAAAGQLQLRQWSKTLAAIEKRYGVPKEIIVAIWARETGFGSEVLGHSAIQVLATEAFRGLRKDTFRAELIAALQIAQTGEVSANDMRSSSLGALGQPQFLPSQFLKYAVDFDGDGKRNIWSSVPDSLASIANFLKGKGWIAGRSWGVEAKVPASVACSLEGPEQGKPLATWAKLDVKGVDGRPLPGNPDSPAYLLMPAGRFGPAFVVSDNFYLLKQYNNSDLYALFVANLADRLAGDGRRFVAPWRNVAAFRRGDVRTMQNALVAAGYDVGKVDGFVGFKTRIALGLWQARHGEPPTCFPDAGDINSIR
ncbi:MAG TPA: lytic murein transglycosylase [Bauldia sp.]|nr:lytic murein transglycosylase [Bauldia sp.]